MTVVVPGADGTPDIDLLDPDSAIAAARAAAADALHPGYGFLSENADFADAVEGAGIGWVGPPASAIRAMGDKASARRLAASLGIPVVPGYDEQDQSDAALAAAAGRIGFPLLTKPAAGGGGKGMRLVRDGDELGPAIATARRESFAAFGDDRLILERYLAGPRHVEIQVLLDGAGGGVHLGERDCSLQRRHQKVLEESPSPFVDAGLRATLGEAALRLAASVGYRSAGTCEFLVDDDGQAWFLEMNTRLQVEHPVTELVTGRDLVADQLAIAGGSSLAELGLDQAALSTALATGGHAVEVRLYAEDAEAGFLPATGRVALLRWPEGAQEFGPVGAAGVRVDAGIEEGSIVGPRFDPMLAKLIVHGRTREEALGRLAVALDRVAVLGLVTNLRFLRWLVRRPELRAGDARIDTLERIWPPDDLESTGKIPDEAWETAARAIVASPSSGSRSTGQRTTSRRGPTDPWAGGWRLNGPRSIRLAADGEERAIAVPERDSSKPRAQVPGKPEGGGRLFVASGDGVHVDVDGRSVEFGLAPPPDVDRAAREAARHAGHGGITEVTAPMPGSVLAVQAVVGAGVEPGDAIITLEAMKMEHVVTTPAGGTVRDVAVRPGEQVARGQVVAVIEA